MSEIGFGAWAIGGSWGDVYGDGRSERIVAAVLKERGGPRPFVAPRHTSAPSATSEIA